MKASNSILNLLNIRPEEAAPFFRLLTFTIFNGLGIALSFTAINVLIIEHHGISTLPFIYLFSSFLLFVGGFIYCRQENRVKPMKLLSAVMILAVIWAFSARGLIAYGNTLIVIGIAFCSYYLIHLLTNLAFSTAAFILFDVRQGKRLFGPLAVGESAAQLLGYGLALVVVRHYEIQDILYISGASFLISWFLLHRLIKADPEKFDLHRNVESDDRLTLQTINFKHIYNLFKSDAFARSVSILSILSALLYFTIHYAFLDRMEYRFQGDENIALYFSILLIIAQVINILIKLFISSRVLNRFGVKIAILILPVLLLVINAFGLIGLVFGIHDIEFFIWIFGISFLADEALRSSMYNPTYMTLFQPMARNRRRESHTLSKGIMEPLGMGIAGLVIILLKALGVFDLETLTICIMAVAGLWCLWSFKVIHAYLRLLYDALKFRILNKQSTELSRDEIQRLKTKLSESQDPYELLYIAKILDSRLSQQQESHLIETLIRSDDTTIKKNAIAFIQEHGLHQYIPSLQDFMNGDDNNLASNAIYAIAALKEEDIVDEFSNIKTDNPIKEDAILGSILKYGGLHGAVKAGAIFLNKINSSVISNRVRAAHILGEIGNPQYYHPLIPLLADTDIDIQKAAIRTVGRIKQPKLLPQLIKKVDIPKLFSEISKASISMKEDVMPIIRGLAPSAKSSTLKKYMVLASKVGGPDATTFLISGLNSEDHAIKTAGINGLHKLKYRASNNHTTIINDAIDNTIEQIHLLNAKCGHKELDKAVINEIKYILRPQLLQLLGIIYGHRIINKVSENLNISEGDFKSNALELLENSISNSHSQRIIPLFENDFLTNKKMVRKIDVTELVELILKVSKGSISDWIKAIAIRTSSDLRILETDHWIQKIRPIHNRILEEEIELYIQTTS